MKFTGASWNWTLRGWGFFPTACGCIILELGPLLLEWEHERGCGWMHEEDDE